jgi:peptide/nickel transport system substrate-binding protein
MRRRPLLAAAAAAAVLPRPSLGQRAAARPLRFVPIGDVPTIDPVVTTTYMVRNHGFLVWDTLYGLDGRWRPQPQMAEGHAVEEDGLRVSIRLREGLRFHDGEPVLARDAIASIRRWGARDALGQTLMARTAELSAPDDRTVLFRLHRPFPLLLDALAKTSPPVCFVMPERLAQTDPATPIREAVGSGPWRYLAAERVPGARLAYERFDGYVPRPGAAEVTSGGKVAHIPRIEWRIIPDPATAAAALQAGEVDWWKWPTPDLLPLLRRQAGLVVENADPMGYLAALRPNTCTRPSTARTRGARCYPRSSRPTSWRPSRARTAPCGWTASASSRRTPPRPRPRGWRR